MGITTFEELEAELKNDTKIKVAGIDADGVMRGKVMAKDKFMSAAKSGFGFCRYCPKT
jgi:glutamine synthetase